MPVHENEGLKKLQEIVSNLSFKGQVTFEMGRAISAACGVYITQICDKKTNMDINYCIVMVECTS